MSDTIHTLSDRIDVLNKREKLIEDSLTCINNQLSDRDKIINQIKVSIRKSLESERISFKACSLTLQDRYGNTAPYSGSIILNLKNK